jgi:hypothetical protein
MHGLFEKTHIFVSFVVSIFMYINYNDNRIHTLI